MNDAIAPICFFSFLGLAPALLLIKFATNRPAWWLILAMIVVLGWGLVVGTYVFYHLGINDLIALDEALPEGWDSDGASGIFAVFFGWLLSIAYFTPWLAIYILATTVKWLFKSARARSKSIQPDLEKLRS